MQQNQGTFIQEPKAFSPNSNQFMKPYFQTQFKFSLKCGLHAINNLLGGQYFSADDFNKICKELQAITLEHYSHRVFGGDYDVSVLIKALNMKTFEVEWHDARKKVNEDVLRTSEDGTVLQGYLLNVKMPQKFYHSWFKFSGRHWIAIKIIPDSHKIYKMDSNQKKELLLSQAQLLQYLENERSQGSQILKVYKRTKNNEKKQKNDDQNRFF